MSKEFVVNRLRSPTSAVFPRYGDEGVRADWLWGCNFRVEGFVDAQNGFGAQVRSVYSMKLSYSPAEKSWSATDISIRSR